MLNSNQFERLVKLGDYVRIFINGKVNFSGFMAEMKINKSPNDCFRLSSGDGSILTGDILFDGAYEFEIYRKVNDEIRAS